MIVWEEWSYESKELKFHSSSKRIECSNSSGSLHPLHSTGCPEGVAQRLAVETPRRVWELRQRGAARTGGSSRSPLGASCRTPVRARGSRHSAQPLIRPVFPLLWSLRMLLPLLLRLGRRRRPLHRLSRARESRHLHSTHIPIWLRVQENMNSYF